MYPKPEFIPTWRYLPRYYADCEFLRKLCDAIDAVCFRPMFDEIVMKHAVYDQFRDDLASAETWDDTYEQVFSSVFRLPYPWPPKDPPDGYPISADEWAQKRIRLHLYVHQFMHQTYTWEHFDSFVKKVEKELHYYESEKRWLMTGRVNNESNLIIVGWEYSEERLPVSESVEDMFFDLIGDILSISQRILPCNMLVRMTGLQND